MMANCFDSRLPAARLQSAGMSLRLVRSPVAPKMTMTQGETPVGFVFAWFMRGVLYESARCRWDFLESGFLFRVTAELKTHGRQNLVREIAFIPRQETF